MGVFVSEHSVQLQLNYNYYYCYSQSICFSLVIPIEWLLRLLPLLLLLFQVALAAVGF